MSKEIEEYINLYPKDRLDEIRRFFAKIEIVKSNTSAEKEKLKKVIAVLKATSHQTLLGMLGEGYNHIIQEDRPDFAFALITTAFIVANPTAFYQGPLPFLFKSYNDGLTDSKINKIAMAWTSRTDKDKICEQAVEFFSQNHRCEVYMDQILFLIDELISNSSPVNDLKKDKKHIFMAYSADRLLIGNKDSNICLLPPVRQRLHKLSLKDELEVQQGQGGAGLGFPMMINSATNFYFVCDPSGGTLSCALIDMRRGLRDLEITPKNVHFFEVN